MPCGYFSKSGRVRGGALAGSGVVPQRVRGGAPTGGEDDGDRILTVRTINGDYAYLVSDQGAENQVAMFLLPEGTDVGSRLKCEDFQWTLVEP